MPSHGKLEKFDENSEDIINWLDKVGMYIKINKIDEEDRTGIVFTTIGTQNYAIIKGLLEPLKPETCSWKQLVEALIKHFKPKTTSTRDTFVFQSRKQLKNEKVTQYYNSLKLLASTCKFGNNLERRLTDQFVFGLLDSDTIERLMVIEDLSLEEARSTAIN
jgi:hypothetical protein